VATYIPHHDFSIQSIRRRLTEAGRQGAFRPRSDERMGRKLFVGNLSFDTTSDDLKELFSQAGTCESAQVMTDRATGRSRGFGFVEMSTDGEAQKALEQFNGRAFQGRNLNVSEARERTPGAPRGPRPPSGGGPGRGFDAGFDAGGFGGGFGGGGGGFGGGGGGGGGFRGPGGPKPRKDGGSRRGLRARKRSL
jgi:RNA recognition motif-containing protein